MTLPTIRVQPQVQGTPQYSAPRVAPQQDATGEQLQVLGQGLAQSGYAASRAADFLQDEQDEARSQTTFNLYAEEVRKLKRAYESQVGEAGVNGLDPTLEALGKLREQFTARLENRNQQELFARRADVAEFHARDDIERHGTTQKRNYAIGAQEAGAKNSNTEYLELWRKGMPQDPEGAALWIESARLARETGLRQVNKAADLHGDSPEIRKAAVLAHTTEMHDGVIRLLASDRPAEAEIYLKRYSEEIDPRRADELRGLVGQGRAAQRRVAIEGRAQELVEKILEGVASKDSLVAQRQDAFGLAAWAKQAEQLPLEVYDEAVTRLKQHFAEQEHVLDRARTEALNQTEQFFAQPENAELTIETLPIPMRTRLESLGALGDAKKVWSQQKALRASKKDVEQIELARDLANIRTLTETIEQVTDAELPGEPTPEEERKFEEDRKKRLDFLQTSLQALMSSPRKAQVRAPQVDQTAPPPPRTPVEEMVRDALEAWARERYR